MPISVFKSTLESHRAFLSSCEPKLIIDVLSVKEYPKQILNEYLFNKHQVILTHPMFGPDTVKQIGVKKLPIVFDQINASLENINKWKTIFENIGLKIIEMSAAEHDKNVAKSQSLAHFIGRALELINTEPSLIDTMAAKKLHEIKEQVVSNTWQLFEDMHNFNQYTKPVREEFINSLVLLSKKFD